MTPTLLPRKPGCQSFVQSFPTLSINLVRLLGPILFLLLGVRGYTQTATNNATVTYTGKNVRLETVFAAFKKQTGYFFFYNEEDIKRAKPVTVSFNNVSLEKAMQECIKDQPLSYTFKGNTIFLQSSVISASAATMSPAAPAQPLLDVKGRILDENGEAVVASVLVKGSTKAVSSNEAGEYKLGEVASDATLVVSGVNIYNAEVGVMGRNSVNVSVKSKIKSGETVVVGYGISDKESLTGSVAKFTPAPLGAASLSVDQMMVGKVTGVHITPSGGTPGGANAITIRGLSTFNDAGNDPLIVVDGIPVYGIGHESNQNYYYDGKKAGSSASFISGGVSVQDDYTQRQSFEKNALAFINPDDIASIEVLKDAYATSIYGSRGAAGVILITTKKGKNGKMQVNANVSSSISKPFGTHKLMTGDQYADFYTEYYKQLNPALNYTFPKGVSTNWRDEMIRTAVGMQAGVNAQGGSNRTTYFFSMAYNNQPSYIINSDYTRYTGRIGLDQQIGDHFKTGTHINLTHTENTGNNAQTLYREALLRAPNLPVYNPDGTYFWGNGNNPAGATNMDLNPVAKAYRNIMKDRSSRIQGDIYAEILFTPWLSFKTTFGNDWFNSRSYYREKSTPLVTGGMATESLSQNTKWVINNIISLKRKIGASHNLDALVGQTYESSVENINSIKGAQFPNDDVYSIMTASQKQIVQALERRINLLSYLGRLNYEFANRYLVGVTYRIDGSSSFPKNHRYQHFPSFSAGWKIHEENFMKGNKVLSQLKLRGSIGFTGTDGGAGYYGYQGQYSYSGFYYGNTPNIALLQPNNPNLQWERTVNRDIGLDFSLMNARISGTFDYYNRKTTGALLNSGVPLILGFSSQLQNLADIANRGWEFSINANLLPTGPLKWNSTFTISRNTNIIQKIHKKAIDLTTQIAYNGGKYWKEGYSATSFFMYDWAGVDPATGQPLWRAPEGKTGDQPLMSYLNTTTPDIYRKYMGDAMPKAFGAWTNSLTYKGFELNFALNYAFRHKMFNGSKAALYSYTLSSMFGGDPVNNLSPDLLDYWKSQGNMTNIPKLINNSNMSGAAGYQFDYTLGRNVSRFLEDASFVKLRNITFAYDCARLKNSGTAGIFKRILVFVQADNVFVITHYSGIDPEVSAYGSSGLNAGYDELTLPNPRIFTFGIKLGM